MPAAKQKAIVVELSVVAGPVARPAALKAKVVHPLTSLSLPTAAARVADRRFGSELGKTLPILLGSISEPIPRLAWLFSASVLRSMRASKPAAMWVSAQLLDNSACVGRSLGLSLG